MSNEPPVPDPQPPAGAGCGPTKKFDPARVAPDAATVYPGALASGDPPGAESAIPGEPASVAGPPSSHAETLHPDRPRPPSSDAATLQPGGSAPAARSGPALARPGDAPQRRFGKFALLEELGSGGMGTVYKAFQGDLQRMVALKVLNARSGAGSTLMERFLREARAAAKLDHPGIVRVFEIGEHDEVPYFTMEFVEGKSLAWRLKHDPPPVNERARWIRDAARAVQHAHGHGIVHRDIKPHNILLDAGGVVKVADFGLAHDSQAGQRLTLSGETLGTPHYMPPEQAEGDMSRVGPASDVYSLGATLYELIAGKTPVEAPNLAAILERVVKGDLTPIRELAPQVPRDLETIVGKALDFDPARRYPTAEALAQDLDRFLHFEAIEARPETWWERRRRQLRRNWRRVAAAAAALAVLAGGAAYGWREVDRRVERAQAQEDAARRLREAQELLRQATNPEHVFAKGGVPEQIRLLERAVAHAPEFAEGWYRLGAAREGTGALAGAVAAYEAAAAQPEAAARARARLAFLLVHYDDSYPAQRDAAARGDRLLAEVLAASPDQPYARLARVLRDVRGQDAVPPEIVPRLEALAADAPEARLLLAGINANYFHPVSMRTWHTRLADPDVDRALREVSEFCGQDPLSVAGRMNLALLRYDLGDLRGAERDLRFARDNAPGWDDPAYYLGRLLFVLGRYPEAEAQFRAALAIKVNDQKSNALALTLMFQRRHEEALARVQDAIAYDPEDSLSSLLQALVLLCLGREEEAGRLMDGLGGRTAGTIAQIRSLDKDLQRPEMALMVSAVRTQLAEFPDVMFHSPKEKEAVCRNLAAVLRLPQLQQALKQYMAKGRTDREAEEIILNIPRVEREAPEVMAAAKALFKRAGIATDPHTLTVLAQFSARVARDAELQKRRTLLTAEDCLWRAGIHYREGRVAKSPATATQRFAAARADLEEALKLDRSSGRAWYALATVLALLGEHDRCADALRQARTFGWEKLSWAKKDPDFEEARKAEAVKKVLEGVR